MNEIETKLNSKNPVLIGQVIARLVDAIRKNYKSELKQVPEYKYLSEKCVVDCKAISAVASKAIVQLVELNVLPLSAVIEDFISKIFGNGCVSEKSGIFYFLLLFDSRNLFGVVSVLYRLLIIEKDRNKKSSYELSITSHPLVQILERNSCYATTVLDHIKNDNSR